MLREIAVLAKRARATGRAALPTPPTPPDVSPGYDFTSHFVDVYDARMHYVDEGPRDAAPILFLHGNPTWSYLWRNVIPPLTSRWRCVAPDLVGMGRSEPKGEFRFLQQARYLEGFVARLGLRGITLVVHDWGSALGLQYALRAPVNVRGMVLMEAMMRPYPSWEEFPRPGMSREFVELFRSFRGPAGTELLVDSPEGFVNMLLLPVAGRPLSAAELSFYREPFLTRQSRLAIWRWTNEIPVGGDPPDVAEAVERYSEAFQQSAYPKLLLYSPFGVITNEPEVEWARAHLQNLTVTSLKISAAGPVHFLQECAPDAIAHAIAGWLQTDSSSR